MKIEDKFDFLLKSLNDTSKMIFAISKKSVKKSQLMATINIILMTSTTILLGLKLGQIGQSIAFVFSALATGLSSWYSIETMRKKQHHIYNYGFKLMNLASDLSFYKINSDVLEEDALIKYNGIYSELRKKFGEDTELLLSSSSVKKESIGK